MPRKVPALLLAALVTSSLATTAPPPAHAEGDEELKVLLLLDSSGSMKDKDPSGGTKLAAAQKALGAAVETLPEDAQVGLRVYGATIDVAKPTPASCRDTQLVSPVAPRDVAALKKTIAGFTAKGDTPIAHSLAEGIKDLGSDGKRHVVLVSDGEETCSKDPCGDVKKALAGSGVTLQVDTVGFGVNDTARKQLQCIAAAGRGTYYDAKDAGQLTSTMTRLTTRAARSFAVKGTPVVGTPTPSGAPELAVGQYTDTVTIKPKGETLRHYAVRRTIPGSALHVSVLGRSPISAMGLNTEVFDYASWNYSLALPDGTECSTSWDLSSDTLGLGELKAGTVVAQSLDPLDTSPSDATKACAAATDLVLQVKAKEGIDPPLPVEIRVMEEPPATNAGTLPKGVTEVFKDDKIPTVFKGTPRKVVGGASFNDAVQLAPGSYVAEIVPGERIFFATKLDWGQGATFAVDGPDPAFPTPSTADGSSVLWLSGDVFAPDLGQIDSQELQKGTSYQVHPWKTGSPDNNRVPEVRYRNRWDSEAMYFGRSHGFSMAGTYYFAIGVGAANLGRDLKGVPVPVRFSIGVDGQSKGAPAYAQEGITPAATASGTASASPMASETPSDTSVTPVAASTGTEDGPNLLARAAPVLLGLLAAGAGAWAVVRRRRPGRTDAPDERG